MAYQVAYEVDWRDAFNALGTVNLDSPGTSLTYDGVTWRTPAVADGNPVDQVSSTLWQLEAGGLRCVEPDNSTMTATNNGAPHLYASLLDLANNASSPFEADPTLSYIFQVYVSSISLTPANNEGAFVALYKLDFGVSIGNATIALSVHGQRTGGQGLINYARAGAGALPASQDRTNLSVEVPSIHWTSPQRIMFFGAPWNGVDDDWPSNPELRFIGGFRALGDLQNDVVCDPPEFRVACGHTSQTISSSYDGTIQRFRILQEVLSS